MPTKGLESQRASRIPIEYPRVEHWLQQYGVLCVLLTGFMYGVNIPCPLGIVLMAAGGMARQGNISWFALLACCPLGLMLGEQPWFFLGRRAGPALLYRIPFVGRDRRAWVDSLKARFLVHGPRMLLTGRFVPGLPACVVPLAGMMGVPWSQFFAWDLASTLIYTTTYSVFGNILSQWFSTWQIVAIAIGLFVTVHLLLKLISLVRARSEQDPESPTP